MYLFLKDASFCPCFCFVHTIAQFSRILRFSHIYCQIFRIRTHGWRKWRTTALTSTIGSEKFQKFKYGTFLTLSTKNEIQIIWLHTCPVLDCFFLLYDRTGRWNHMIIASVKVFFTFFNFRYHIKLSNYYYW